MELMLLLSEPSAPRVTELDLEQNTHLSWRCALPLALALGMSPDASTAVAADWAAVAAALPPGSAATPASVVLPSFVPSAREKVRVSPGSRGVMRGGTAAGSRKAPGRAGVYVACCGVRMCCWRAQGRNT